MKHAILALTIIILSIALQAITASTSSEGVIYLSNFGWILLDSSTGPSYIEYNLVPLRLENSSLAKFMADLDLAISDGKLIITLWGEGWSSKELIVGRESIVVDGEEYPLLAEAGINVVVVAWQGWAATVEIRYPDGKLAYSIDLGQVPTNAQNAVLRVEAEGRAIIRYNTYYAVDTSILTPDRRLTTFLTPVACYDTLPVRGGYAKLVGDKVAIYLDGSYTCIINLGEYSGGNITKSSTVFTERPWVWWVSKKEGKTTYWVGEVDPTSCRLTKVASIPRTSLPNPKHRVKSLIPLGGSAIFVTQPFKSAIIDPSTGDILNKSNKELKYITSNADAGIAVFTNNVDTFIVVRE